MLTLNATPRLPSTLTRRRVGFRWRVGPRVSPLHSYYGRPVECGSHGHWKKAPMNRYHCVAALLLSCALAGCSSSATSPSSSPAMAALSAVQSATAPSAAGQSSSVTMSAAGPSSSIASSDASKPGASTAELNACSLMTTDQLSGITGDAYTSATASTIADGQDQCDYNGSGADVTVIIYQDTSGVSFASLIDAGGADTAVSGVGDKAEVGPIELDVQAGKNLIAIQNAGGTSSVEGGDAHAVAAAKLLVAALG